MRFSAFALILWWAWRSRMIIALSIILTTGATLHQAGVFDVQNSAQAAEALKPVAGEFAFIIFALGIVGTGLLTIPILAASAAYAIGEGFRWPTGLSRRPNKAPAFYGVLTASALLGVAITLSPIDPSRCCTGDGHPDAHDGTVPDHGKVHDYRLAALAGLGLDHRDGGLRRRYGGGWFIPG
jgi:Mn2+/Fe2+ NRAMP family transporter